MKRLWRNNGLTLLFTGLFLAVLFAGQLPLGHVVYNETRTEHGLPPLSLGEYVLSGHFLEATMENWESEFLQMFAFVLATALLFQKGSAESRDPDSPRTETRHITKRSPSPVRKGGWRRTLYGIPCPSPCSPVSRRLSGFMPAGACRSRTKMRGFMEKPKR